MNYLGITPNSLYKDLIINPDFKRKIEINEKISKLSSNKIEALFKIIDILKDLQ